MSSEIWSAIISGIALIAAVISPVITTVINNQHRTKADKHTYFEAHRAEVIENYIRHTGSISKMSSSSEDFRLYGKYSKEIYLYLPENLWSHIDKIDTFVTARDYQNLYKELSDLCKALNKHHPRPINKRGNKHY